MQRARNAKKPDVKTRKLDRQELLRELRQVRQDELAWVTGGRGEYDPGDYGC